MHLAQRAYVLISLAAVLAIAGIWSSQPGIPEWWKVPGGLLLLGLAAEAWLMRRPALTAELTTAAQGFLGRAQPAYLCFSNAGRRSLTVEYAPVAPPGVAAFADSTREVRIGAAGIVRDPFLLLPVRLGPLSWPSLPARIRGPLGLAWWSSELPLQARISVAPDTLRAVRVRPLGNPTGFRSRRVIGAGSELHQLRGYVPGDPPARIDWKATARTRKLVTREYNEDQHLDVLVAVDAGRLSQIRAGPLDRYGLYANIAARLAETVVPNDDRIGLLVFAERPVAFCPPDRGLPALTRMRRTLERLVVETAESDPLSAAVRIRRTLRHRSLVVLLTDISDRVVAGRLVRAVKLLSPPHLVVVAGVRSQEIADLARAEARDWRDPWIALAAQEHEHGIATQKTLLRRLGAPVIVASEDVLEQTVLLEYEALRRARRV
ncbi:MAG TPA: DUF58 domain-containing protein [Steroidobacteraceae bacterium]|nr:DUF58 domain-containing protein [Steroidobacteraceae bacterium]